MGSLDTVFRYDIVLDQEAFNKAISDFSTLSTRLEKLRADIEDILETLETGFDTPAGRKFINSCKSNLIKPMNDQKLVIDHIFEALTESQKAYESVFSEYQDLNSTIKSYVQ